VSPSSDQIEASSITGPIAASTTPALEPTTDVDVPTQADDLGFEGGYVPPKKDRTKMYAGGVIVLAVIAAGVFFMLQRSGDQSANVAVAPASSVGDSAALVPPPPTTAAESAAVNGVVTPGSTPAVGTPGAATPGAVIDSQAVKDSIKKARAAAKLAAAKADSLKKADSAKRAAAATTDSARKAQSDPIRVKARAAASGLLANAGARKTFTSGATHKGGLLGSRSKGDLQTQIDALQPFLKGSGLTYEQFKAAVAAAGIPLFDEFGRMVPDELQRFVSAGH